MHKDSTTQAKQKKDECEEVLREIRQLENRQKILENKQRNEERLDLYAGKVWGQRKNALQNGPALNQAAGAGLAFLVTLLVLQNLLAVLKLPDFPQDFFALVFLSFSRQYHQAQRGPFRCCRSRLPKRNQTDE